MKKLLSIIILILIISINVFAAENNSLKLQFNTIPDSPISGAGWINLKDIINNENVSVTVFNGGEDAFACFISARDDNWATVNATEQIYIEAGESETLILENYDEACSKFMLEFRELYEGATVYLRGKDTDYSKIQKLSTDLGDHFVLSCEKLPQKEVVITPTAEETPETTKAPVVTQAPVTTEKAETYEEKEIYVPKDIYVSVTTLVTVSTITALAGVFAGGLLATIILRKNKKG